MIMQLLRNPGVLAVALTELFVAQADSIVDRMLCQKPLYRRHIVIHGDSDYTVRQHHSCAARPKGGASPPGTVHTRLPKIEQHKLSAEIRQAQCPAVTTRDLEFRGHAAGAHGPGGLASGGPNACCHPKAAHDFRNRLPWEPLIDPVGSEVLGDVDDLDILEAGLLQCVVGGSDVRALSPWAATAIDRSSCLGAAPQPDLASPSVHPRRWRRPHTRPRECGPARKLCGTQPAVSRVSA